MTDKPTPVSVRKNPGAPRAAGPTTDRPTTIKALIVVLLLVGITALIAAASLFGQHDYLVKSMRDNQPVPPITATQIQQQGSEFTQFFTQNLTAHPQLGATQIGARATDAQNWAESHLPKSNVDSSDISDQASKLHDAVSSDLSGVSGNALTSAQIQQHAQQVSNTYVTNLKDLQQNQPKPLTQAEIIDKANKTPGALMIYNGILLLALVFVALSVWRGKHWSRWAVIGLWFILSFTGVGFGGLSSALYAFSSALPVAFRVPLAASGVLYIVAVVLCFLRPSVDYFNANRPARPAGAPARRGLFAPRVPPTAPRTGTAAAKAPARTAAPSSAPSSDRSKAKQRASADAVAKGAELARSRAKASKSRRTGA